MSKRQEEAIQLRTLGLSNSQVAAKLGLSVTRAQQLLKPHVRTRAFAIRRAHYRCECCQLLVGHSGHVHHRDTTKAEGYNELANLQLLCRTCHVRLHLPASPAENPIPDQPWLAIVVLDTGVHAD